MCKIKVAFKGLVCYKKNMTTSLFYYFVAFLAPFFYAISVIIESFLSLAIFKRPIVMLFFVSLTNALFTPFVLFLGWPTIPTFQSLMMYVLIALIDIGYLYPYYVALKKTDVSIVSSLFSLGQIFVPILAFVFLGDSLTLVQYIGFFTIIFTASFLNKKSTVHFRLNKAFYLMFISSFLLAIRVCCAKFVIGLDQNVVNVLIYPNLLSGLIPFTFLLSVRNKYAIKRKWPVYKKQFKFFAVIEFLTFLAVSSSTVALEHLSPVVSKAIEATEPLFVLTLALIVNASGIFHFKEKTSLQKKVVCFLLIISGIVLTCFFE